MTYLPIFLFQMFFTCIIFSVEARRYQDIQETPDVLLPHPHQSLGILHLQRSHRHRKTLMFVPINCRPINKNKSLFSFVFSQGHFMPSQYLTNNLYFWLNIMSSIRQSHVISLQSVCIRSSLGILLWYMHYIVWWNCQWYLFVCIFVCSSDKWQHLVMELLVPS